MTMGKANIAAISRKRSEAAIRCEDGQYTLISFLSESWTPAVGESVEGDLRRLGFRNLTVGDGDLALVEVQSYNCSMEFAKARLTA